MVRIRFCANPDHQMVALLDAATVRLATTERVDNLSGCFQIHQPARRDVVGWWS